QEVVEAESSIEVKRKKDGFDVRAIFGLIEGFFDPSISSDHYHFDSKLEIVESEEREQSWQHIPGRLGPEKVDVMEGFRAEPKVAEEQLDTLINLMTYMMEKEALEEILIAVVDDTQIITDAKVKSGDTMLPLSLDQRSQSRTLISDIIYTPPDAPEPVEPTASEPAAELTPQPTAGPALAHSPKSFTASTKIILKIDGFASLEAASGDARNDVLLTGDWIGPSGLGETLAEASRKFPSSEIIVQMGKGDAWLKECIRAMARLGKTGGNFSLLLPGMRTLDEHRRTIKTLKDTMPDSSDMPGLWACVAYPSNLFFLEELARDVDVVSVDLESLALHMTGHTLTSKLRYDEHSLREALELLMKTVKTGNRPFGVHTPDFFGSPALLEFLIRRGANILAVSRDEVELVSQIIKTLEIKIAAERA
ncbi:MAG: hypothetical protein KAS67_03135, partial [Thermoplasmata archaeon]|nr:hypothetical protein [Thermoplasmata archaeon]